MALMKGSRCDSYTIIYRPTCVHIMNEAFPPTPDWLWILEAFQFAPVQATWGHNLCNRYISLTRSLPLSISSFSL